MEKRFTADFSVHAEDYGLERIGTIRVDVVPEKQEDDYLLHFTMRFDYSLLCSRCLAPLEFTECIKFQRTARRNGADDGDVQISGNEYLIEDAVMEELGLVLPFYAACEGGCEPLHERYREEKIDPRLKVLEKLIK